MVAPSVLAFRREHPGLEPQILTSGADVAGQLRSGRLDVVFQEEPVAGRGLATSQVATMARSVWCGRGHPLYGSARIDAAALATVEFVAPPMGVDGIVPDGWPVQLPRRIGLVVDQVRVGVEVCLVEPLLAVLPDVLAAQHGDRLWQLPVDVVPSTPLFGICRQAVSSARSPALLLIEAVRRRAAA